MKKVATSFTCDHCSTAVDLHAVRCPTCGKAFDAVRCPRCGHQGAPAAFFDGCPQCRYLAAPVVTPPSQTPPKRQVALFGPVMTVLVVLLLLAVTVAWFLRVR